MLKAIKSFIELGKKLTWDWSQPTKDYSRYLGYKVRSKRFRNLTTIAIFLFVFIQALVPGSASALNPKFNFLPGDYELLRGANSTQGDQQWHDPVSANIGDVVSWNVYYHNGVEGTVAYNTTIQVVLPTDASTQLTLFGKLWADNASMVTDNGTVNLNTLGKIRYIPGSTIWYKEGSTTPQPLPDGITENGVNIGDIPGCWPYAGFVVFQTEIISAHANLYLDKKVGNSTEDPNSQNWYKENTANPGDYLAYRLYIKNTGNIPAQEVRVRDSLPQHINYVPGTTKLYNNDTGPSGAPLPDGITSPGGILLGELEPGSSAAGYVVFQVQVAEQLPTGVYTLINSAFLWASNAQEVQSSATTTVTVGPAEIAKSKSAFNVTQGIDATTSPANGGDVLRYTLRTQNLGEGIAENFVISDDLSDILEYADLIDLGGGSMAGSVISYPAIDIFPGQTIEKTFKVRVKDPVPTNPQNGKSYDLIMENVYGDVVMVEVFKPVIAYHLNKLVRNITREENEFQEITEATYGEQLEYKIEIANTGNVPLTNIYAWDALPEYQELIPGTVKYVDNWGGVSQLPDYFVSSSVHLPDIQPGIQGAIYFQVQIDSCPPAGVIQLINTAWLTTNQTGEISDTAQITLVVYPPNDPPPPFH